MGLKQNVEYPNHIKGNNLDLIFTDEFKADYKLKEISNNFLLTYTYEINKFLLE